MAPYRFRRHNPNLYICIRPILINRILLVVRGALQYPALLEEGLSYRLRKVCLDSHLHLENA